MNRNQQNTKIEKNIKMNTKVMNNSTESHSRDIQYMLSDPKAFQELREYILVETDSYCVDHGYYHLIHREDCVNLVDEVILKIWDHRDRYLPEKATVKTWAKKIAQNQVSSYITFLTGETKPKRVNMKARDRMGKGLDGTDGEMDVERIENYFFRQSTQKQEMTDEYIQREEYFQHVQEVYDLMDEKDQKLFVMLYGEYKNEEIAEAFEMKKGAVATMKSRWRSRNAHKLAA